MCVCFLQGLETYLIRELSVLKNLRNSDQKFMVTYVGAYNEITEGEGPHALYIVTEYCQGGNLLDLLEDVQCPLGWRFRMKLALQAASAVHYLHELNFIHRDIKSEVISFI